MTENLSEEQLNVFRELFESVDHQSTGEIDLKQCLYLFQLLGISMKNKQEFRTMIDEDRNRKISFKEFNVFLAEKMHEGQTTNLVVETFKYFDKDHDGMINLKDLSQIFLHLGEKFREEELKEMLITIDSDHDGKISLEDFIQMTNRIKTFQ